MNRYAITINNWEQSDLTNLLGLCYDYIVIGFEKTCQGIPHLQCYLEVNKNFKYLQRVLPRAHIEKARKTREVNAIYCKKSGHFIEDANRPLAAVSTVTKKE